VSFGVLNFDYPTSDTTKRVLDPEILAERWEGWAGFRRVVEMNAEVSNSRLLLKDGLAHVLSSDAVWYNLSAAYGQRKTNKEEDRTLLRVAYIDVPLSVTYLTQGDWKSRG
jgi:hypothetical protein